MNTHSSKITPEDIKNAAETSIELTYLKDIYHLLLDMDEKLNQLIESKGDSIPHQPVGE